VSRFIINNDAGIKDETAIALVCHVIDKGKISNYGKQYCYASCFGTADVYCTLTRSGTYSFRVTKPISNPESP